MSPTPFTILIVSENVRDMIQKDPMTLIVHNQEHKGGASISIAVLYFTLRKLQVILPEINLKI